MKFTYGQLASCPYCQSIMDIFWMDILRTDIVHMDITHTDILDTDGQLA